jgi:hypothetical protein
MLLVPRCLNISFWSHNPAQSLCVVLAFKCLHENHLQWIVSSWHLTNRKSSPGTCISGLHFSKFSYNPPFASNPFAPISVSSCPSRLLQTPLLASSLP